MAEASPSDSRFGPGYGAPASPYPQPVVAREHPSFLRGFAPSKTTRADGEAPKRRGPKPDSKPAATKRQEMNRLAQRTHRERKDQYAHELEQRVKQARDTYFEMVREQDQLQHENQEMAQLLRAHGIPYQSTYVRNPSMSRHSSFYSGSPADSFSAASMSRTQTMEESPFQASMSVPSRNGAARRSSHSSGNPTGPPHSNPVNTSGVMTAQSQSPAANSMEYASQAPIGMAITTDHQVSTDSIPWTREPTIFTGGIFANPDVAIEFLGELEAVCHEHKKMMCVRGANSNPDELSGHALMLTSLPEDQYNRNPAELSNDHYHQMPNIQSKALLRMLHTSSPLLDFGPIEVAPVQALEIIQQHERVLEITLDEFKDLRKRLNVYMNCYGYVRTSCLNSSSLLMLYLLCLERADQLDFGSFRWDGKTLTDIHLHRFGAVIPQYALREELESLFIEKDRGRASAQKRGPAPPGMSGFHFDSLLMPERW
ncbi:MAG: hypothetical protein Q9196_005024 [Gyalolechia fulgens]